MKAQEILVDSLVTMTFENIQHEEALNMLYTKYKVQFSYSDSNIEVNDTVNIRFNNMPVKDVLNSLFQNNRINYNFIGNQIVLSPFNPSQTITVKGRVFDKSTGLTVAFANIALARTNRGTTSNEESEFQLSLTKIPSELLVSHSAHEKTVAYVYDDSEELNFELMPSPTTLKDITISARKRGNFNYQLVKKAYKLLKKTRPKMKFGKVFYRQKLNRENEYVGIFEIFYDIKYSKNGIEDWAVQEGQDSTHPNVS